MTKTIDKSEMFGDPSNLKRKLEGTCESHLIMQKGSCINKEF